MPAAVKTQISFEFMLFTTVSALGLLYAVNLFSYSKSATLSQSNASSMGYFIAIVNSQMAYQSSVFSAYIPKGLCGYNVEGYLIKTNYGDFTLNGRLSISNSICAYAGYEEELSLEMGLNGTYVLGVVA